MSRTRLAHILTRGDVTHSWPGVLIWTPGPLSYTAVAPHRPPNTPALLSSEQQSKMVVVAEGVVDTRVPAPLPGILREYTKAAIRTQPRDLLAWSCAYFKAMTQGSVPPVKDRLEFPIPESESGISPGVLRVLHRQLRVGDSVQWEQLRECCEAMGVAEETAQDAWHRAGGGDGASLEWDHILSHLAALSAHALQLLMAALTEDPVTKKVDCSSLLDHYRRLHTHINITPTEQFTEAVAYLNDLATFQGGYLTPKDLTRSSCPVL
ncbi:ropporin-1-like protein isoform X2 [Portunus trituberculatus]|uniref:ropporin-1-like protein isoform X2 n=1 Tax=Portunus trituberculatus TaxID=210409 RepID=UPI001E1D152A|nr:ropporin-1-like protein isoform X2 [Portunus trituberculatus]